jgi:hypothetical protein
MDQMTAHSRSHLDAALALNEQLLESLGPEDGMPGADLLDDEAFAAEIERRCD